MKKIIRKFKSLKIRKTQYKKTNSYAENSQVKTIVFHTRRFILGGLLKFRVYMNVSPGFSNMMEIRSLAVEGNVMTFGGQVRRKTSMSKS